MVEELRGDADALARRAGVPEGALDDDEMLVQDTAIATILEVAARELECPDFGLRVALNQDLSMLGPLAVALQNSPSVGEMLECTSKYLFVHARSLSVSIVADPRGARGVIGVRYGYPEQAVFPPPQSIDMGLLFLHRSLVYLLGAGYGLRTVEMPHARTGVTEGRFEELFGARVNFHSPAAVLRVPRDLPGRPIEGGDQVARQLALYYLDAQLPAIERAVTGRARAALQRSLGTGPITVAATARLLAMSPRTLQRMLADEGTTYAAVLDETRRVRAAELLTRTDLPLAQIASVIGLQDATTFSQYARRWWGMTARQVRAQGVRAERPTGTFSPRVVLRRPS